MKKINVLLTCVSGPGGVSAVKSLQGLDRFNLIGVDSDALSLGLYSEGLSARYCVPAGDAPGYLENIEEIARRHDIDIIFPLSDEEVTILSQHKKYFLDMGVTIPIADYDTVSKADDKLVTVRIAEEAGVTAPETFALFSLDSVNLSCIQYPAVIKPRYERGGRGIKIVNDEPQLIKAFEKLAPKYGDNLMVQEYIPGRAGSVYLFAAMYDAQGRMKASFMSRSIKTKYEFGGPGEGGEPVVDEELRAQSRRLLQAVGRWFGPVNIEFKKHPDSKKFYLLEINPRYWGYSYLATATGINFPLLTMMVALGEEFDEQHEYSTDIITLRSMEHCVVKKKDLLKPIDF